MIWLVPNFLKWTSPVALKARFSLKQCLPKKETKQSELLTPITALNHLLEAHAIDDVVAEADKYLLRSKHPMNSTPLEFVGAF